MKSTDTVEIGLGCVAAISMTCKPDAERGVVHYLLCRVRNAVKRDSEIPGQLRRNINDLISAMEIDVDPQRKGPAIALTLGNILYAIKQKTKPHFTEIEPHLVDVAAKLAHTIEQCVPDSTDRRLAQHDLKMVQKLRVRFSKAFGRFDDRKLLALTRWARQHQKENDLFLQRKVQRSTSASIGTP